MQTEQPKTKKTTHPLTAAQQRYCRELVSQINQLDTTLRSFLNYVVLESDLPKAVQGYSLSPDINSLEGEIPDTGADNQ